MISTADLQDWLKADDADAPVLRSLEQAAVKAVEAITGRCYGVVQSVTDIRRFKGWPLELANEPIGGVLTSLEQWTGTAYQFETLSNYYVDGSFVWPNMTFAWPLNLPSWSVEGRRFRAIYQAGYTVDALDADVWPAPADIQQAVKLLVGHWHENRESVVVGTTAAEVPMSVQMLLSPHSRVAV
jgi:uncharacterized phiE125 gp8 family phage protein